MIKDFFISQQHLDESFGVTDGRGHELHMTIKKIHDQMVENFVRNKEPFDKSKLIIEVLGTCATINEEAYALYLIGLKISRLQAKLDLLKSRDHGFGMIVDMLKTAFK